MQPTLAATFANAVVRGTAEYPVNYVPNPIDIHPDVVRPFMTGRRCLGWFKETVSIGGIEHEVKPLLRDLRVGGQWYPDPHFHCSASMGEFVTHHGTFWHKQCQGFDCANCPTIPSLPDFKKRLERETESLQKRGSRVCEQGVRLKDLQRQELINSVKVWQSHWRTLNLERYWLNLPVLNLSRSKEDLSSRLQRALSSQSLPEIAEFFKRALEAGAFEGRSTLLNFLLDLGKNLITVQAHDGRGMGKRHSRSTKFMYECLLQFGGPLVANFLNLNVLRLAINTCKALYGVQEGCLVVRRSPAGVNFRALGSITEADHGKKGDNR